MVLLLGVACFSLTRGAVQQQFRCTAESNEQHSLWAYTTSRRTPSFESRVAQFRTKLREKGVVSSLFGNYYHRQLYLPRVEFRRLAGSFAQRFARSATLVLLHSVFVEERLAPTRCKKESRATMPSRGDALKCTSCTHRFGRPAASNDGWCASSLEGLCAVHSPVSCSLAPQS